MADSLTTTVPLLAPEVLDEHTAEMRCHVLAVSSADQADRVLQQRKQRQPWVAVLAVLLLHARTDRIRSVY